MHIRGPAKLKQFAVYTPSGSSSSKTKRSATAARRHAHAHAHAHKRDAATGDMVYATIDGKAVSWANAYTGARLDWKTRSEDKLTLFWAMPQTRLPNDKDGIHDNAFELDRESSSVQFFGGSFTKAAVADGTVELYAYRLHERDEPRYP